MKFMNLSKFTLLLFVTLGTLVVSSYSMEEDLFVSASLGNSGVVKIGIKPGEGYLLQALDAEHFVDCNPLLLKTGPCERCIAMRVALSRAIKRAPITKK